MACLVDGTLKVETLMSAAVPNRKLTCVYALKEKSLGQKQPEQAMNNAILKRTNYRNLPVAFEAPQRPRDAPCLSFSACCTGLGSLVLSLSRIGVHIVITELSDSC
jgi:hypothetical protein